jgi:type I restriction enzyme M protein
MYTIPACGTAVCFIEAIHHINNDKLTYGRIFGQEKNLSTSAIARMNLFLHGAKDFKIVQGDTLRDPKFLKAGKVHQFNCVIANPPFGLDGWGAPQFEVDPFGRNIWGCPSDSSADWAWIQHMISSMKPNAAKTAVIMPQSILLKGGKDAFFRKSLVESDLIECIITLVPGIFFATGIDACIILLNNNKDKSHKSKICMIDASKIYTAKRAQNIMTDDNIEEVYKLYQGYENIIDKCQIVSQSEIKIA